MKDGSAFRVTTCSSFGPTLEFESLPIVGEDRDRGYARARRFWLFVFVVPQVVALATIWLIAGAG